MQRKLLYIAAAAAAASVLFGCGKTKENTAAETETSAQEQTETESESTAGTSLAAEAASAEESTAEPEETVRETYESRDGWKLSYDSSLITATETDEGVNFVYTGECSGTNMIAVSYFPGKQPQEILTEKTVDYDDSEIIRSEGWFVSQENWSFTRVIDSGEGGSGLHESLTAVEHNGGALLFDSISHDDTDEDRAMRVSDTLADMIDSFEFTRHDPQVLFDYVPGTYEMVRREEIEGKEQEFTDTVVLNENHTGEIRFQDDIPVYWTSIEIVTENYGTAYEYTIEGDTLMMNIDGDWKSFDRKQE